VLLAASAVAPHLAAIGILSLAVAVVLAVNGFEYWIVATGRPLPLVSRRT
jgi:hypothetical protein